MSTVCASDNHPQSGEQPHDHQHDHHHATPGERLEASLAQASRDPAYLALFYRELLAATVYLPLRAPASKAEQDDGVAIEHWEMSDGTSVIPFFSTPQRLQQVLGSEEPGAVTALPARELFSLTRGERLFLNPKCAQGKAFYPQEIALLLERGGMVPSQCLAIEGGQSIRIGPLEHLPGALQEGITTLCGQRGLVRSAWLVRFQDPQCDTQPVLLLALELEGDDEAAHQLLIHEAGTLLSGLLEQDAWVDVCCIRRTQADPLADYLRTHITPIYQRRWGGWLRNAIPSAPGR
ncbi:enhanced serine sensitivity protein SseB C-terminal domain-containing protein [Edwardsiella hoshinae]|uniref:enhanced serine sensitivity protein SseB C-terminal domain-containing protein n=1 Tax=Edwardsiella hoshinae TaxID=93378 RepID=UPI00315850AA